MKLLEPVTDDSMALILSTRARDICHGYTRLVAYINSDNIAIWNQELDFATVHYNKHIHVINYLLYLTTKE